MCILSAKLKLSHLVKDRCNFFHGCRSFLNLDSYDNDNDGRDNEERWGHSRSGKVLLSKNGHRNLKDRLDDNTDQTLPPTPPTPAKEKEKNGSSSFVGLCVSHLRAFQRVVAIRIQDHCE